MRPRDIHFHGSSAKVARKTKSPSRSLERFAVPGTIRSLFLIVGSLSTACSHAASNTNLFVAPLSTSLPETGPSLLRVLGALALVLGLFLGGAWFFRNGRFSAFGRGRSTRLNVLETRSLGSRQAIYVVGYGQERFLIGSTPAGINLLSHLASASEEPLDAPVAQSQNPSFSQALVQVLRGQKPAPQKSGGKP